MCIVHAWTIEGEEPFWVEAYDMFGPCGWERQFIMRWCLKCGRRKRGKTGRSDRWKK